MTNVPISNQVRAHLNVNFIHISDEADSSDHLVIFDSSRVWSVVAECVDELFKLSESYKP